MTYNMVQLCWVALFQQPVFPGADTQPRLTARAGGAGGAGGAILPLVWKQETRNLATANSGYGLPLLVTLPPSPRCPNPHPPAQGPAGLQRLRGASLQGSQAGRPASGKGCPGMKLGEPRGPGSLSCPLAVCGEGGGLS